MNHDSSQSNSILRVIGGSVRPTETHVACDYQWACMVEMEKHSFSQKEEGREEAFNDGQNKRSTNLLEKQTIF